MLSTPFFLDMDIVALINCCDTYEEVELIESFFQLNQAERDAAFSRKLGIVYRSVEEDLARAATQNIHPDLFNGWSVEQRNAFERDWQDDSFLEYLFEEPPQQLPEPNQEMGLAIQNNQLGEGKRKHDGVERSPSKRSKAEEYFTIKPGKTVNVRKFRTTGMFHVQFHV